MLHSWRVVAVDEFYTSNTCRCAQQPDLFVKRKGADKIVIFAHGILGDARGTFTNDTTHAYWPQLLADDTDIVLFDVLAINYDAGVTSGMNIEQIATVLRTTLTDQRIFDDYNEIYFICHSMGAGRKAIAHRPLASTKPSFGTANQRRYLYLHAGKRSKCRQLPRFADAI